MIAESLHFGVPRNLDRLRYIRGEETMKITISALAVLLCWAALSFSAAAQKPGPKPGSKPSPKPAPGSSITSPTPRIWPPDAPAQIRAVLEAQVAAWNAGKLEEFMAGYWRSPELTFYSGGQKLAGWDATLARYRKNYQAEGKEMGKLQFSELEIKPLGEQEAVVGGRWGLTMANGKQLGGLYTLIFRRFNDGWKIVHDHTSTNQ